MNFVKSLTRNWGLEGHSFSFHLHGCKIGANKASQVGSLHAATGVSRGGSFALKLIPKLHIVLCNKDLSVLFPFSVV